MLFILSQGCCVHLRNLKAEDGTDAFCSPWGCVNECCAKSQKEVWGEYRKSREAALKSERALLWNLVPGAMYYQMFKKSFLDDKKEKVP
jgi:hypothetical protein